MRLISPASCPVTVSPSSSRAASAGGSAVTVVLALAALLAWSYGSTLVELGQYLWRNQDYSVGLLVPPVAAWLVWRDRHRLAAVLGRPSLWGLAVLGLAELTRWAGLYFGVGSAPRYALLLAIAGLTWLVAGRPVCWRLRWVWAFLLLTVPLPARVHEAVALPLQNLASASAAFGLELMGFFVIREGNVLQLEGGRAVAVAEACSGLRLLTAFVFETALLAFLVRLPAWQKATLVLSSIPIAVACNTLRVIATSLFVYYSGSEVLSEGFHDVASLAMMPLAIVCSVALVRFLRFLAPGEAAARASNRGQR